MPLPPQISAAPSSPRAAALDALRGFAILAMVLSGLVPRGTLPTWMYHAQLPPPDHRFDPALPGLTWVDLVFPFFLFSLGAALPLAFGRRVARGESPLRLAWHSLVRGLLLLGFAIYVQHLNPWALPQPLGVGRWLLILLGFALPFLILTRIPNRRRAWLLRTIGVVACIAVVWELWYRDVALAETWSSPARLWSAIKTIARRSDIIIVVLANVAAAGGVAWLLTRTSVAARLLLMLGLIAIRLASKEQGWVRTVYLATPLPSLYQLYFLQYLLVVIPGTLVGDALERALKTGTRDAVEHAPQSATSGAWLAAAVSLALIIGICAGLQSRMLLLTTITGVTFAVAIWALATPRRSKSLWHRFAAGAIQSSRRRFATGEPEEVWHWPMAGGVQEAAERELPDLARWGAAWLILGLLFEPYEGGIRKDSPTLSYYFVTSGLACYALIIFTVLAHAAHRAPIRGPLNLLVANGQNPMIAYLGIRALLPPVLALTGVSRWVADQNLSPWSGFAWACVQTLLLALAVAGFTRLRLFWRT